MVVALAPPLALLLVALLPLAGSAWCGAAATKNSTINVQCQGMTPHAAASEAACAAACCASKPPCATYLFGVGAKVHGCYLDSGACQVMSSPSPGTAWVGATKIPLPPPPPPQPPPPPPNGLRQELYRGPGCPGTGTPDMTYRLDRCGGQEPFPHNASHPFQGTIVSAATGISGTSFKLQKFSTETCAGKPCVSHAPLCACLPACPPHPLHYISCGAWADTPRFSVQVRRV
jgi:hypothetical protein